MARSVKFNAYDTFIDWGLHWSDYQLSAPEVKTNYIEIPGSKTRLDGTEVYYGGVTFSARTITLNFWKQVNYDQWMQLYTNINNQIAGQRCEITLDTDKNWHWIGRPTITSQMDGPNLAYFTITCDVEPYKVNNVGGTSL